MYTQADIHSLWYWFELLRHSVHYWLWVRNPNLLKNRWNGNTKINNEILNNWTNISFEQEPEKKTNFLTFAFVIVVYMPNDVCFKNQNKKHKWLSPVEYMLWVYSFSSRHWLCFTVGTLLSNNPSACINAVVAVNLTLVFIVVLYISMISILYCLHTVCHNARQ